MRSRVWSPSFVSGVLRALRTVINSLGFRVLGGGRIEDVGGLWNFVTFVGIGVWRFGVLGIALWTSYIRTKP